MNLKFLWVCCFLFFTLTESKVLNRFHTIQEWSILEGRMVKTAKEYIQTLQKELSELERFVEEYEATTLEIELKDSKYNHDKDDNNLETIQARTRANLVASNPLHLYKMCHRLVTNVPRLQQALLKDAKAERSLKDTLAAFSNPDNFAIEDIPELKETWPEFGLYHDQFPSSKDLDDALGSLSVLYDVYQSQSPVLNVQNFIAKFYPDQINAYHAMQISLKAIHQGFYGNSIDWILYAWKRVSEEDFSIRDDSISRDLVEYTKDFIVKAHNVELGAPVEKFTSMMSYLNFYREYVKELDSVSDIQQFQKEKRTDRLWELEQEDDYITSPQEETVSSFYKACTTRKFLSNRNNDALKCYLDSKRDPYFRLSPLKVEKLSQSPKVLQFHDILGEGEISKLEEITETLQAFPNPYDDPPPTLDGRRELSIWTGVELALPTEIEEEKIFAKLQWKAKVLSGLHSSDNIVDSFSVNEFVAGRYLHLHRSSEESESTDKQLAATLDFHLRTAEKGGETVYGLAGPLGAAVKGSAIYQQAIYRNGTPRLDAWHGSCPVIQGSKLTFTKFFSYNDQFHNLKCSLDEFK